VLRKFYYPVFLNLNKYDIVKFMKKILVFCILYFLTGISVSAVESGNVNINGKIYSCYMSNCFDFKSFHYNKLNKTYSINMIFDLMNWNEHEKYKSPYDDKYITHLIYKTTLHKNKISFKCIGFASGTVKVVYMNNQTLAAKYVYYKTYSGKPDTIRKFMQMDASAKNWVTDKIYIKVVKMLANNTCVCEKTKEIKNTNIIIGSRLGYDLNSYKYDPHKDRFYIDVIEKTEDNNTQKVKCPYSNGNITHLIFGVKYAPQKDYFMAEYKGFACNLGEYGIQRIYYDNNKNLIPNYTTKYIETIKEEMYNPDKNDYFEPARYIATPINYKPVPADLSRQYKTEMEQIIDEEYSKAIKDVDILTSRAKFLYNKILNEDGKYEDYTELTLIPETALPAVDVDLFTRLVKTTQEKYLDKKFEQVWFGNSYYLDIYIYPYLEKPNVDTRKIIKLNKYTDKKIRIIEKYLKEIKKQHQMPVY